MNETGFSQNTCKCLLSTRRVPNIWLFGCFFWFSFLKAVQLATTSGVFSIGRRPLENMDPARTYRKKKIYCYCSQCRRKRLERALLGPAWSWEQWPNYKTSTNRSKRYLLLRSRVRSVTVSTSSRISNSRLLPNLATFRWLSIFIFQVIFGKMSSAMSIASKIGKPAKNVADAIVAHLDQSHFATVSVAGPGAQNIQMNCLELWL